MGKNESSWKGTRVTGNNFVIPFVIFTIVSSPGIALKLFFPTVFLARRIPTVFNFSPTFLQAKRLEKFRSGAVP